MAAMSAHNAAWFLATAEARRVEGRRAVFSSAVSKVDAAPLLIGGAVGAGLGVALGGGVAGAVVGGLAGAGIGALVSDAAKGDGGGSDDDDSDK